MIGSTVKGQLSHKEYSDRVKRFKFEWLFQTPGQLEKHKARNYILARNQWLRNEFCQAQMQMQMLSTTDEMVKQIHV
jgi:hypothetical protein